MRLETAYQHTIIPTGELRRHEDTFAVAVERSCIIPTGELRRHEDANVLIIVVISIIPTGELRRHEDRIRADIAGIWIIPTGELRRHEDQTSWCSCRAWIIPTGELRRHEDSLCALREESEPTVRMYRNAENLSFSLLSRTSAARRIPYPSPSGRLPTNRSEKILRKRQ